MKYTIIFDDRRKNTDEAIVSDDNAVVYRFVHALTTYNGFLA